MEETQAIDTPVNEATEPMPTHPEGEYAIIELMGHQTIVGRVNEVDRFGTKFMQIEPIYLSKLLGPILQGGSSIYRVTPCSAEVAFNRGCTDARQLPAPVRATLPVHLLPAPPSGGDRDRDVVDVDEDEMPF